MSLEIKMKESTISMTELEFRTLCINEYNNNLRYIKLAKENKDPNAVTYFSGYADAIMEIIRKIDFVIEKETNEMEKQENDR